jgi:hypothetical protein
MALGLHNVILVWDVYVVAESPGAAREAAMALALHPDKDERIPPSETNALPVLNQRAIRESWLNERPIVADDVSDADFERVCKGHTVTEVFAKLHTKGGTK